jgi:hypothetical protein
VAVGFAQAIAFTSAHFLPRWSELSDSFPDQHVSWFSWFAAAAEVTGAGWLGICGLRVLPREGLASILVLRPQRLRPATTPARNGRHVRQRTRGPP